MSNACRMHATKRNSVASAKYRPGHILLTHQSASTDVMF